MSNKIWEETISGTEILAGATLTVNSDPTRYMRGRAAKVGVQAVVKVTDCDGGTLTVAVWGQDSVVWPNLSVYETNFQFRGTRLRADTPGITTPSTIAAMNLAWVPAKGFRGSVQITNTSGSPCTPTVQIEMWLHED